jgi:phosphate transport system permease protein
MAVTMVIGNRPQISASLFAPAQTLASVLANEYAEASGDLHLSALSAVGCALLLVSVAVHIGSRWLIGKKDAGA